MESHRASEGFSEEPKRASVRTRAADVYSTAELLFTAVRIKVDVSDDVQETEQAAVSMNDLDVFRVAARYPGSWTGQMKAG